MKIGKVIACLIMIQKIDSMHIEKQVFRKYQRRETTLYKSNKNTKYQEINWDRNDSN